MWHDEQWYTAIILVRHDDGEDPPYFDISFDDPSRTKILRVHHSDVLAGKKGRKLLNTVGHEKPPLYSAKVPDPNKAKRGSDDQASLRLKRLVDTAAEACRKAIANDEAIRQNANKAPSKKTPKRGTAKTPTKATRTTKGSGATPTTTTRRTSSRTRSKAASRESSAPSSPDATLAGELGGETLATQQSSGATPSGDAAKRARAASAEGDGAEGTTPSKAAAVTSPNSDGRQRGRRSAQRSSVESPASPSSGSLACSIDGCSKTYASTRSLLLHQKTAHGRKALNQPQVASPLRASVTSKETPLTPQAGSPMASGPTTPSTPT
ncbi:uncharacterized protein MONBRDRAFT_37311, partial [Monosiga brevicollis MX1]